MTSPGVPTTPALGGVEEVVTNAKRLGLIWSLRPGTVSGGTEGTSTVCTVIVDGDSTAIPAFSLVGALSPDTRVQTVAIEPEGVYVVGFATAAINAPNVQRVTLGSDTSSVTFTVPSSLRRVTVTYSARSTVAAASTAIRAQINGDSGANYHAEIIQAVGAGAAAGVSMLGDTSWLMGVMTGDTATADFFSAGQLDLVNWNQPHNTLSALFRNMSISSGGVADSGGGLYAAAGPYTTITLFPDAGSWKSGSDFQLEGWPS